MAQRLRELPKPAKKSLPIPGMASHGQLRLAMAGYAVAMARPWRAEWGHHRP